MDKFGNVTLVHNEIEWQLQNLHIHSKNLRLFRTPPNKGLKKEIQSARMKGKILKFTPLLTAKLLTIKIKDQLWKLIDA